MLKDLERLDSEVALIRTKHQNFLQDQELQLKVVNPNMVQRMYSQRPQDEGRSMADKELGSPRGASKDADDSREPGRTPRQQGAMTLAQTRAISKFAEIDMGKVERDNVFRSVPGAEQRVGTRLEYFRQREDQITKRVEIYTTYLETGETAIDVFKLMRSPHLGLRRGSNDVAAAVVEGAGVEAQESRTGTPDRTAASKSPTRWCQSPSPDLHRAESPREKAARLEAAGRQRDEHVDAVRESGRQLQFSRRLQQLDEQRQKAFRKATADRDRVLLAWITAASAAQTMHRLRGSYVQALASSRSSGEGPPSETGPAQSYWHREIARTADGAALAPSLRAALASVFWQRWEQERRALRQQIARKAWRRATMVARFLVAIQRRKRWNDAADVIKNFLEAAWGENKARHAMKVYMRKIRMTQRCMRNALRFRQHICKHIYLPAVWEVETRILGKAMSVSQRTLKDEVDAHRRAWDLELREREAQAIGDSRFPKSRRNGRSSERASHAGSVCGRRVRNLTIVTAHGRVLGPNTKKHGLGDDVEQLRLNFAEREIILKGLLRQGVARYWLAWDDYRVEMREFRIEWQQWRLEAQALGPEFRDSWPLMPVAPELPTEMLKLDMPPLRAKVLQMMKLTGNLS